MTFHQQLRVLFDASVSHAGFLSSMLGQQQAFANALALENKEKKLVLKPCIPVCNTYIQEYRVSALIPCFFVFLIFQGLDVGKGLWVSAERVVASNSGLVGGAHRVLRHPPPVTSMEGQCGQKEHLLILTNDFLISIYIY